MSPKKRRKAKRRVGWRWVALAALTLGIGWFVYENARPVAARIHAKNNIQRVEGWAEEIRRAADESDLDPNLIAAVMLSESGGKVDAVSSANALGLLQLMLPTAVERARLLQLPEPSRADLLSDGELNVRLGAAYLRWLQGRFDGDLEQMLVAYNAGPGRLKGWIDEAGSWEAWRAEREAAGDSGLLRYVRKVQIYRDVFAERGRIVPSLAPVGKP